MNRDYIKQVLIETLTSPTGAGSDLPDPKYVKSGLDEYIVVDSRSDGSIDIEHLTSDVERLFEQSNKAHKRALYHAWQAGRESVAEDMVRPLVGGMRQSSKNPYA